MPKAEYKKVPIDKLVSSPNVAKLLDKEHLDCIGKDAVDGYLADRTSREGWETRNIESIKLALQVTEQKTFPWPNCANVKFPMVTVAALQFLARVSILTKGRQIVKADVIGPDPDGLQLARARRIQGHMSYQVVEEDRSWIDDDEKAKFAASIMGCAFKKTFFDPVAGINLSEYVPASNLVVDYHTKSFDRCPRATHVLNMTRNDLLERERRGVFLKMDDTKDSIPLENPLSDMSDEIQGITKPAESAAGDIEILEQHCLLDLDGDDYAEPYIVFVRSDTCQVLRIVARYFDDGDVHRVNDAVVQRLMLKANSTDNAAAKAEYQKAAIEQRDSKANLILRIDPQQFFTKYTFIPSIDGGFYDLGFGALLGPVNKAVDTLINQQLDAGTMQVTAGGFLGRGVKIKGGKQSFDPFEWKSVDSQGDDLRKNIVPLPTNAPSTVLFQMLGLLIQYGEKVSGATDIMTGANPGQNTPAETSRNTVEQGMKLFSGIYTRMHRGFQNELRLMYRLNQLFLDTSPKYFLLSSGASAMITQADYKVGQFQVAPAADPATVSEAQRQQKAQMILQMALAGPGWNIYNAQKRVLEAYDVEGIDEVLPNPQGPNAIQQQPDPKMEIEKAKLDLQKQEFELSTQRAIFEMRQAVALNAANIQKMEAQATKLLADADGVDVGHQIAIINAQTGAAKAHHDSMVQSMQQLESLGNMHIKAKEAGITPPGPKPAEVNTPAKAAAQIIPDLTPQSAQPQPPAAPEGVPDDLNNDRSAGMGEPSSDPEIPE